MKVSYTIPTLALAAALGSTFTEALPSSCFSDLTRRQSSSQGYYNPTTNGGSLLTGNTASGLSEPLNVIVSGNSDPGGDGGTCLESLKGGNHFRYWIQNGTAADSGAIFIAASVELNATLKHMIAPDGYDAGRDQMVGNMTGRTLSSPGGFQYTVSKESTQLLNGVSASQINHDIGIDGTVDVLTVKVTKNGTIGAGRDSSSGSNTGSSISTPQQSSALPNFSSLDARLIGGIIAVVVGVTSGLLALA
ncbi:hypothetical protein NDA17_003855 [Ustilago hordei]|nr:hypothetical protein NDA17_003855 [Ustilago hordei]